MSEQNLKNMFSEHLCVGCGLCSSLYPNSFSLDLDDKGYYRPKKIGQVDVKAAGLLKTVCPAYLGRPNLETDHVLLKQTPVPFFGYSKQITLAHAADDKLRRKAASGGALSAVLIYLLETQRIDAVMHVGVSPSDPFLNEVKISRTAKEVFENSGSRYAPAAALSRISEVLKGNERFAFVGKPCEVASLRQTIKCVPEFQNKVLYFISFFCAGTPSMNMVKHLASHLNMSEHDVSEIRYRGAGWPGSFMMTSIAGEQAQMSYDESWGKYLGRSIQNRCKLCFDGIGESADLAFGDAWYLNDHQKPDFTERDGRNVILARNPVGQQLLDDALSLGYLDLDEHLEKDAIIGKMQPYQFERRAMVTTRLNAFRITGLPKLSYPALLFKRYEKEFSLKYKMRQFLGTLYRLMKSSRFNTSKGKR